MELLDNSVIVCYIRFVNKNGLQIKRRENERLSRKNSSYGCTDERV